MIKRTLAKRLKDLSNQFPAVIITGPRQSGKTTLVKNNFDDYPYVNMERPDIRDRVIGDPAGFFQKYLKSGVIIDEAQNFEELGSWMQTYIDKNPVPAKFILTGSNQLLLRSQISQSLAGRAAYIQLDPFIMQELQGTVFDNEPYSTETLLWKGFYPPLYDRPFDPVEWFIQYRGTYLERDLTQLISVKNLSTFRRFLGLCAGRTGQILNLSDLARDSDISHTTAKHWLSILEAGFLIFFLPPWHRNYNKRLIKSPKLYFTDVGLAGNLIGITDPLQWETHPLRGAFFETMVIANILKTSRATNDRKNWFFWSSPGGIEVDLISTQGTKLECFEIKSSATFKEKHIKNLQKWKELANLPPENMHLLYNGSESFTFKGISVERWNRY